MGIKSRGNMGKQYFKESNILGNNFFKLEKTLECHTPKHTFPEIILYTLKQMHPMNVRKIFSWITFFF